MHQLARLPSAWLVPLLLLLCSGRAEAERIWARVDQPGPSQRVRDPIGLVEVRGVAGTGQPGHHDIVLVIDRSGSTWMPSGSDVDGDEIVGTMFEYELRPGQPLTAPTDPDDSIASAQLIAARRLIERLDAEITRMGIVTFGGVEHVLAGVGTPSASLLAALDSLPDRPEPDGTYFYGGLMTAIEMLQQAPPSAQTRHRSIILFSDGLPNRPLPQQFAEKAAISAAKLAGRENIRIYSFALGAEVARNPGVFHDLTRANRGELLLVERPGEIVDYVPHMSLTRLSHVEITNLTTNQTARAVRLFPDGSFDGYAPLTDGPNLLRITVFGERGADFSIERSVYFERIPADTAPLRRRLEILLEELRTRTLETQLAAEARRKRERALERSLQIEVEE